MGYQGATAAGQPSPGRIAYLDHAATTPLRRQALETMTAELADFGVVGDLFNVVPQLTEEVTKRSGG